MSDLPWNERVTVISIHPDSAGREEVGRLASEWMEAVRLLERIIKAKDNPWDGRKNILNDISKFLKTVKKGEHD